MVKHEIKVEISSTDALQSLIEKAYFENGQMGRIMGKHFLNIENDVDYTILKDIEGPIKVYNKDIIDGNLRFMVDKGENDEIRLNPISIYCIIQNEKYVFY